MVLAAWLAVALCWTGNSRLMAQFESAYYSNLAKNHQSVVESALIPGNTIVAETITGSTRDIHLMELDAAGNLINERTYDSGAHEEAFHICLGQGGGYIVCGYQLNAGRDRGLILQFDANFNLLNQARYHNTASRHSTAFHVIPTVADPIPGYVVVGALAADFSATDIKTSYVLKLDLMLNKLWERHLNSATPAGPQDWDMAVHVLEVPGQGYFVGGSATATPGNNSAFCDQTVMAARISYNNVVNWKKSMDDNGSGTSGHRSIGADAFYDASTNEVYQLANFSINHHFGIVVYDFATGIINPLKSFRVFSNLGYINLDGMQILPDPSGLSYVVAGYLRDGNYTQDNGTSVQGTFPFACEIDKASQAILWDELYPVPSAGFSGSTSSPYDLFFGGQQPLNLHPKMALRYGSGSGYALTGPREGQLPLFETVVLQMNPSGLNPCLKTQVDLNPIPLLPAEYPLGFTSATLARQQPALTLLSVSTTPDPCATAVPCVADAHFTILPLGNCCYEFKDLVPEAALTGGACNQWEIFDALGNLVALGSGDSYGFCFATPGIYHICNTDCCINSDGTLTTTRICQLLEVSCCDLQPNVVISQDGCIYSFQVVNNGSTPTDQLCFTWLDGTTHSASEIITTDLTGYCGIYGGCINIFCCNSPNNAVTYCFDQYVCCQPCDPNPAFDVSVNQCCVTLSFLSTLSCLSAEVATADDTGGATTAQNAAMPDGCCTVSWGDGTVTSGVYTHCYAASGVYTICYTACCTGSDGQVYSETHCETVTVTCCCLPFELGTSVNDCTLCLSPFFECANPTPYITYDYGDGNSGSSSCHTYAQSGTYTVCMTACCYDPNDPGDLNGDGTENTLDYAIAQQYCTTLCTTVTVNCGCEAVAQIAVVENGCVWTFTLVGSGPNADEVCIWTDLFGVVNAGYTWTQDFTGYCGGYGICYKAFCCNEPLDLTGALCIDYYINCCGPCDPDPAFNLTQLDGCCVRVVPLNPGLCLLSANGQATEDVNGDGVIDSADTAALVDAGCCTVNWGDGTSSAPGIHCYTASGIYTICYTACCTGSDGQLYTETLCQQVTIDCGQPCDPVAQFEYSTDACCVSLFPVQPTPCQIGATGATVDANGDGVINDADYWVLLSSGCCTVNWGDGTSDNGIFTHCYSASGTYTICYTACCVGANGQLYTETHCETITVHCCEPADFTWSVLYNNDCQVGVCINPGPDPSQYCALWNWGDGTSGWYPVDMCPTHTYDCSDALHNICVTLYCCNNGDPSTASSAGITQCATIVTSCCTLPSDVFLETAVTGCTGYFSVGSTDDFCGELCIMWDFGDGTTDDGSWSNSHTYTGSGWYTVCATVMCCNTSIYEVICAEIYIDCGCCYPVDFTTAVNGCSVCVAPVFPLDCQEPSLVFFDYGDGSGLTTDLCHTYAADGNYLVCMYAECPGIPPVGILCHEVAADCGGCCPNADFSWSATTDCYTLQFNGPGCDFNGSVFWSFGDGGTALGYNPVHTFPGAGWYHVCMHICCINPDGTVENTQVCHDVYVPECGCVPDAGFWWEYTGGCCVAFHDLTPEGNPFGCESWVFGLIQSVLAGDDVTFCFPGSGWYTICHFDCCVDAAGNAWVTESCQDIWIDCGGCCTPNDFTWTCTDNCCFNFSPLQFTDCVTTNNTFLWSFGDGSTSTEAYPTYCYAQNGIYEVCMTVTCPTGASETYCHYIQVNCVPCVKQAQIDPTMACIDLYDPVCGCDGVTYSNSCYAYYYGGVTSWTPGACNSPCIDPALIDPNAICPLNYDPVCGCDGNTYSNDCFAQAAGVTTWTNGPCPQSGACCLPQLIGIEAVGDCCYQLNPVYLIDCLPENTYEWVIDGVVTAAGPSYVHCFPAAGTHTICLNVYCPNGQPGVSFCEIVECGGGSGCCPPAGFTYTCSSSCCFAFTPFYLADCLPQNTYTWHFGDGSVSNEENPTHCYSLGGLYQVCVDITCPDGTGYSYCQWVTANCPSMCCSPSGIFAFETDNCCVEFGPEYFLTDCDPSGNTYFWYFGDGNTSTEAYPVHCYAADGTYTYCLTVTCPNGQTAEYCETITTACAPCDASLFPKLTQNGCVYTVTFSSSTTPLNEICVSVEGGPVITADQFIQVLDFSDNCYSGYGICYEYWCCSDPSPVSVGLCVDYIVNCCCTEQPEEFGWSTGQDCCTQFFYPGSTDAAANMPCLSWDFGDGTTSNEPNPVHCWSAPGTYTVCLTTCCTDAAGNVLSYNHICQEVEVDCCTLPFDWFSSTDACTACFSPVFEGPNPTTCILWSYGDGTWGWGTHPCHTYTASGVYEVCMYSWCCAYADAVPDPTNADAVLDLLEVLDEQGLLEWVCKTVSVQCLCTPPCDVHAGFNQELTFSTFQFTNTSATGPGTTVLSYAWDFGDGNTSNLEHPAHTYAQTGTYLVCLTVTAAGQDGSVCSDTFCFPVVIPCKGDADANGVVNILDVLLVLGAFGVICP